MNKGFTEEIEKISTPFQHMGDLLPLIDKIKNKKVVMLGEASHGTHEFYEWRRRISLKLIKDHGFNFIAVEGDWPPCEKINHFIKGALSGDGLAVMKTFTRWPTWMWANSETLKLMQELNYLNQGLVNKIGFHGLDVYSLYESMGEVVKDLEKIDSSLAQRVKNLYACFDPYKNDERDYARSLYQRPIGCEEEVIEALQSILHLNLMKNPDVFDAFQNARIVHNAEKYYRAMINLEDDSWNVRDQHMMETLEMLLENSDKDSKAIVWAHNTHIGDYRATDMVLQGQVNIGGLARERFGQENVALVGFTTYRGSVVAGNAWDATPETMTVPKGRVGSLEEALHNVSTRLSWDQFFIDLTLSKNNKLNEVIGHRAIGVVYHPSVEHRGNYVPTIFSKRYDSMIFFDRTQALHPLFVKADKQKIPETFPFGNRI